MIYYQLDPFEINRLLDLIGHVKLGKIKIFGNVFAKYYLVIEFWYLQILFGN